MNIPTYLRNDTDANSTQENYNEELNEVLRQNLSDNGLVLPSITDQDLTVTPVQNPNTLAATTLADLMPNGTAWYVTDAVPPCVVIKIDGALEKLTTSAYP